MKLFLRKKYVLFEITFLFILSLTPLLWFKSGHIVIGLDSGYAVDYVKYFQQRESTWMASQNFGVDMSAEVGIVPYNSLPAIIKAIGVGEYDVQKVLFVAWFFILSISMYAFAYFIFPEKEKTFPRIAAVIIYIFNLHIYSFWLQGEQPILASYALLPLVTFFLLKFLMNKSSILKTSIYLNIVYLFFGSGGVRGVPLIGPVIVTSLLIFIYFLIVNFKKEKLEFIKRLFLMLVTSLVIFSFLNAYYLIPFISSFALQYGNQVAIAGGIEGAISWAKFISTHTSILNISRLQGDNNWYDKPYLWAWNYLTNPFLIAASFAFPIFAFSAPLFKQKKREKIIVILFLFLGLAGILLSAGTHPPLGFIYELAMRYIPGFAAYRSAYYKFMPIVYLSFAILIGFTISNLINKANFKIRNILGVLIILFLLLYHYPYFTNTNFEFNKPFSTMVKVPEYVQEFAKFEDKLPDKYRTLVIPPPSDAYNVKTFTWGYWSSYPIFPLISDRGFVINDSFVYNENENNLITAIYNLFRKDNIESFLNGAKLTNIKYVLLLKDMARFYHMSPTEDPSNFNKALKSGIFTKIWEKGAWSLYEIKTINSNKINVYGRIGVNYSTPESIGAIVSAGFVPFLQADSSQLVKSSYINGEFRDYGCASCIIKESTDQPGINTETIYPTSHLYPLKLKLEKIPSSNDLNGYLGLSLKRISELNRLNYVEANPQNKWLVSAKLYKNNWENIERIYNRNYRKSDNYGIINSLLKYSTLEMNVTQNIIDLRHFTKDQEIGRELIETLSIIKVINEETKSKIYSQDWNITFEYDINGAKDNIYIDKNSLPSDSSGNPILPSNYKLDDNIYQFINKNEKEPSLPIVSGANRLTLFFGDINLLNPLAKIEKVFDKKQKNCLVSDIQNYSGFQTYVVYAKVDDKNMGVVYIKRESNIFKTLDSKYIVPPSPDYDLAADTYTFGTGTFEYTFKGSASDRGAKVYFCSDRGRDPETVFSDIRVFPRFHPVIFTKKPIKQNGNIPSIHYKKINSTTYELDVKNAKDPFIMTFSERFSPLWDSYADGKKIPLHFLANGYANGWFVDKTGNYKIMLIFRSQKMLQIGVDITIVTFILLILYLFFKRNEK